MAEFCTFVTGTVLPGEIGIFCVEFTLADKGGGGAGLGIVNLRMVDKIKYMKIAWVCNYYTIQAYLS